MTSRTLTAEALTALILACVSAAATAGSASSYRILLQSDRDGRIRTYSARPDGSDLRPLLSAGRALQAVAVSRDGRTVVYRREGRVYVSRADGSDLHVVLPDLHRWGASPVLSPDGRLLAFSDQGTFYVVGTNGGAPRHIGGGAVPGDAIAWSPDGRRLVLARGGKEASLVIRPLDGAPRVLVHRRGASFSTPSWSPDGRWIAFRVDLPRGRRVDVVRASGRALHTLFSDSYVPNVFHIAWAPNGRELAFPVGGGNAEFDVAIGQPQGGSVRRLGLGLVSAFSSGPIWSPDGSHLVVGAHTGYDPDQIWSVRRDGSGLRRLTTAGNNSVLAWTRLRPPLPPAPQLPASETVTGPATVRTSRPITGLSADGGRVALITSGPADCSHVSVWSPAERSLTRISPALPGPCSSLLGDSSGGLYGVALAGSSVGWAAVLGCGNFCEVELRATKLSERVPPFLGVEDSYPSAYEPGEEGGDFRLRGDGDLLVFNRDKSLVRIGGGSEKCSGYDIAARICTTLRSGEHSSVVDSVSDGQIAIRERDGVTVLDERGGMVRVFAFPPNDVTAARLDAGRLAVARQAFLELHDVPTGTRLLSRPLPAGYTLSDFDGGIALLRHAATIELLRLDDGHSITLTPGSRQVFAELEPQGLYYAFRSEKQGRLVLLSHAEILKRLG